MSSNTILAAAQMAYAYHRNHTRRDCTPYIAHPIRVAGRVMTEFSTHRRVEDMAVAAFLHDMIEDVPQTQDEVPRLVAELNLGFSAKVVELILELTNVSKWSTGTRAERKQQDRDHIKGISDEGKLVKMLDRIDNLGDLFKLLLGMHISFAGGSPQDRKTVAFALLYSQESRLLLEVLKGVDESLEKELFVSLVIVESRARSLQTLFQ